MNDVSKYEPAILLSAWLAVALLVATAGSASAADRLVSGKWESSITTDGDTRTITYCVTPAEATSINGDTKSGREFAESKAQKASTPCAFKSYEIKGDAVSYTMTCGIRTISDRTSYHGETAEGVKTITKDGATISMQLKSRRVGACP